MARGARADPAAWRPLRRDDARPGALDDLPRPDGGDRSELAKTGFLAVDPGGIFNERATFHSARYLDEQWGRFLKRRLFEPRGFVGYQDLSVWEKTAPAQGASPGS